jgi:exopolyphosphatase/guanosine-5'-triphosphate,3'-diphosphate pyrophosphatase
VRAAVVDIGTNSTRLLIADVDPADASLSEVLRRSRVTRLGDGVDRSGSLSQAAIARVLSTLHDYRTQIDAHGCTANVAVLTSAVRDATNGDGFARRVREEYALDARILPGEEEARLTFLGAMSGERMRGAPRGLATVVIDIGGGSTEFIVGSDGHAGFHTSLPAGVVRMSERHIHSDPPTSSELAAIAADADAVLTDGLPAAERANVAHGIAVAGTATSAAAIEQKLDPYDPVRVDGYTLTIGAVEKLLQSLAAMTDDERRAVAGLHPDRAPTIVAGMVLMREALRAFALDQVTVSERDILHGAALQLAGVA